MCDGGVRGRLRREGSPRMVALEARVRRDIIRPTGEGEPAAQGWLRSPAGVLVVGARTHTGGMVWTPAEPEWAAPPQSEIADLMWLAYWLHAERGKPWSAGVFAATAWVRGGRPAPVTERVESPVTRELATAELWAAVVASEAGSGITRPPVEQTCADLGVRWCEPPRVDAEYALGA